MLRSWLYGLHTCWRFHTAGKLSSEDKKPPSASVATERECCIWLRGSIEFFEWRQVTSNRIRLLFSHQAAGMTVGHRSAFIFFM